MLTEKTIKMLNEIKFNKLYNKAILSSNIQYNEACMSAIYFLWGYNEGEARKCLYRLISDSMSNEDALNEFIE